MAAQACGRELRKTCRCRPFSRFLRLADHGRGSRAGTGSRSVAHYHAQRVRRIEYQIREELYARVLSLDLAYFSRERTGDILSRFANDLTNVRMLVGFGILSIINTFIIYTAALVLMVRLSPTLTLCAVIPFPVMILIVKRISASMFQRSKKAQEELARLSSRIEENASAAILVRAYCREEEETAAFRNVSEKYVASNMAMARLRGFMIPVMSSTGALGTLIVLFLGGRQVISGALTLGDFVAFNGYLSMLIWPTIILGWILNLMQRGAASMSRLNHVLGARATVTEPSAPVDLPKIQGAIEFRNLSFGYGSGELLQGISLSVTRGMKVGFAGPIGSGKSTLVRLIPRLYPTSAGMLFIDGVDVNDIPLRQLRAAIGFVPQESFLFSRTIGDNIAYGTVREHPPPKSKPPQGWLASPPMSNAFPTGTIPRSGSEGSLFPGAKSREVRSPGH